MAKSSGGSSVGGGRRGAHVTAEMTAGKAKSLQGNSKGKPVLGTTAKNNQSKVTNKPRGK